MQEDLLVAVLASCSRTNSRVFFREAIVDFDRGLDLAPLQAQAVDLPLDVLVAGLRLLEDQVRARLGVLD